MKSLILALGTLLATSSNARADHGSKVVGGEQVPTAELNDYQWYSALYQNGRFFCGGSLVHPQVVLTAKHCVESQYNDAEMEFWGSAVAPWGLQVHIAGVRYATALVVYDPNDGGDAAAIVLRQAVPDVEPIEVNLDPMLPLPGAVLEVAGRGLTEAGGQPVADLRRAELPVVSLKECRAAFGQMALGFVTPDEICAGSERSSCNGDSGGPLWDPEGRVLYGIVSWGVRTCTGYPSVFVRTSAYPKVIEEAVALTE